MNKVEVKKYWLVITNEDNWETIQNKNVYGFCEKDRGKINNLNKEDILVVYVVPKKIGGFFMVKDLKKLNKIEFPYGNYPFQIDLKKIKILKKPLVIGDKYRKENIIDNLSIFNRKIKWGGVLMGRSIIEIKKEDYAYLMEISKNE